MSSRTTKWSGQVKFIDRKLKTSAYDMFSVWYNGTALSLFLFSVNFDFLMFYKEKNAQSRFP
jgi:hypothetical protein